MTDTRHTLDVKRTAALAHITLTADEAVRFEPQLASILAFIATLDGLDTSTVEATCDVVPLAMPLRDDTVAQGLPRDEVLAQAPRSAEGSFVVPKFVDGA